MFKFFRFQVIKISSESSYWIIIWNVVKCRVVLVINLNQMKGYDVNQKFYIIDLHFSFLKAE